jgi:hypothetical protein
MIQSFHHIQEDSVLAYKVYHTTPVTIESTKGVSFFYQKNGEHKSSEFHEP